MDACILWNYLPKFGREMYIADNIYRFSTYYLGFERMTMKKLILFVLLIFLQFQGVSFAQKKITPFNLNDPVAKVGSDIITADEFRTRYEMEPHPSQNFKDTDSLKKEFLASLIAEHLWALHAKQVHYDTLPLYVNLIKPVRKMFLRDALYKQEVESKVHISDIDLIRGKMRAGTTLKVNILASGDSAESFDLYKKLKKGVSFDSLLKSRDDSRVQQEPVEITFGKMDDEWMEDSLYRMKPLQFSKPMKNDNGWFIFKIVDRITGTQDKSTGFATNVKQIIKTRRSKVIGTEFLEKILSGKKVSYNREVVSILPDMVYASFQKRKEINTADSAAFHFTTFDVSFISSNYQNFIDQPIAFFDSDSPTLREFFYFMMGDQITVRKLDRQNIIGVLQQKLNDYVQYELIYREAQRRHMENLPEVKKDIQLWETNFLSQMLKKDFLDSSRVNDDEVYNYYLHKTGNQFAGLKVHLLEIFSGSLDTLQVVLKKMDGGEDFAKLAEEYNTRVSTLQQEGDFGWQYTFQLGEIGKIAEKMGEGDVYGPMKVEGGYSLFKLLGKKDAQDSIQEHFDAMKDKLKEEVFMNKLLEKVKVGTAKYANDFGVTLNEDNLKNVNVTDVNMFVYRYIGFGGRISAVPYTPPNYEWFNYWKKQKSLLP